MLICCLLIGQEVSQTPCARPVSALNLQVGGIINPPDCMEVAEPSTITRLGDICVSPFSNNWYTVKPAALTVFYVTLPMRVFCKALVYTGHRCNVS